MLSCLYGCLCNIGEEQILGIWFPPAPDTVTQLSVITFVDLLKHGVIIERNVPWSLIPAKEPSTLCFTWNAQDEFSLMYRREAHVASHPERNVTLSSHNTANNNVYIKLFVNYITWSSPCWVPLSAKLLLSTGYDYLFDLFRLLSLAQNNRNSTWRISLPKRQSVEIDCFN